MGFHTALSRPVGIYDSGVGGLSVLRAIQAEMPQERLVYVADSAHVPYGEKSRHAVAARALAIAGYFVSRHAKAIAVPCNTATAAAISVMREHHPDLPIIGIEPAVKPAAQLTRSGVIGVLATTGTLASARFKALAQREAPGARIVLRPCPEWVLAVENGIVSGPDAHAVVAPPVRALQAEGADVLVLGCTHFPFLRAAVSACAGPDVPVLETGHAVARQLRRRLLECGLLSGGAGRADDGLDGIGRRGETEASREGEEAGSVGAGEAGEIAAAGRLNEAAGCEFFTSGDPARFARIAGMLLGARIQAAPLPPRYC